MQNRTIKPKATVILEDVTKLLHLNRNPYTH